MKRIAIFAHYSKDSRIDDYVIFSLKKLKKVAESIIFISYSNIEEKEVDKIKEYTITSIAKHHGEYDFGSYKRGYNNLLSDYEKLILVNDSCYLPLFPFDKMFSVMSYKKLDFWGTTKIDPNRHSSVLPSIQGYLIVFKNTVYSSSFFKDCIYSIKKEPNKHQIVQKYKIGLTTILEEHNFSLEVVYSKIKKFIEYAFSLNTNK